MKKLWTGGIRDSRQQQTPIRPTHRFKFNVAVKFMLSIFRLILNCSPVFVLHV